MTHHRISFTTTVALLSLICVALVARADERPNTLLVIADDMNWDDCGAYGHPSIRTPNIDSLALDGLTFRHAYLTTNSCSASRSNILTGEVPSQYWRRTTALALVGRKSNFCRQAQISRLLHCSCRKVALG